MIGELLAGVLLGPTVFGRLAPGATAWLFPAGGMHFLEVVSWLGMILLLLITGLETDVRAVRSIGRAALTVSVFGIVVPFAAGFALGWALPDTALTDPANRVLFAAFLATAMAISALPVTAKILADLDLMARDVGMVILSAAVIDDTVGWLILSVIGGVASRGAVSPGAVGATILGLLGLVAAARWVVYPVMARLHRHATERVDLLGADLTLVLGVTFLAAAASEALGVHAAIGALMAGVLVRSLPRVRRDTTRALELFVQAGLSPIFFGLVGLKVDLWELSGWALPAAVLSVAIAGKLAGCWAGARLSGISPWASLAVGVGMNARGAMELIVAAMGLSLGLLTRELYATIVLVAIATSFMTPLLLRWIAPRIPLSEADLSRRRTGAVDRLLPPDAPRILVPTAGGPHAGAAIELAAPLVRSRRGELVALHVEPGTPPHRRREARVRTPVEEQLAWAARLVGSPGFTARRARGPSLVAAVLDELERDFDLVMVGAAPDHALDDATLQRLVRGCPLPVMVVRGPRTGGGPDLQRILVPVDGGSFAHRAADVAFDLAAVRGAEVTVLHVAPGGTDMDERRRTLGLALTPLADARNVTPTIRLRVAPSPEAAIVEEVEAGAHDLLVLGTETGHFGRPHLFGRGTADVLERVSCSVAVLLTGGYPDLGHVPAMPAASGEPGPRGTPRA